MEATVLTYRDYRHSSQSRYTWTGEITGKLNPRSSACPYCKGSLADFDLTSVDSPLVEWVHAYSIRVCAQCGWWENEMLQWIEEYEAWATSLSQAILRKFSTAALDVPLEVLRQHLAANFLDVYSVHPQTFERLIADVLKDFFSLRRVEHCGRTHDGGIDAFIVDGEHKMIVQVKRRISPKSAESVSTVRQMFGVLFRDQLREAMIVTTADRFSPEAQEEVREVLRKGLCDSFELVDAKRLYDMLELTQKAIKPVWAQGLMGIVEENGEERAVQLIAGGLAECIEYGNDAVREKYEAIRKERGIQARITYGAYGLWLERSRAGLPGDALSDWLAAEQDVMRSRR